jgi:hypothetical protein
VPGQRARPSVDPFEEYERYCRLRLAGDPHLWATTLYAEVVELGYAESYPSFTRGLRGPGAAATVRAVRAGEVEEPGGDRAPAA